MDGDRTYLRLASSSTPALVIYLLDVSASMIQPMGVRQRVDIVTDALSMIVRQMIFRSTKGGMIMPRYRVAIFAYSDHVYDLLDGVRGVDELVEYGIPELSPMLTTETAQAFREVEKCLLNELPRLGECPAPLVCHLTDGEYTGEDPEPVVRRIMDMKVSDGNVLVENIFISDNILHTEIADAKHWPGIQSDTPLASDYANKLRNMSSQAPDSYRMIMHEYGFNISPGAMMLFPGTTQELVAMGFQMSAATPVSQS